MSRQDMSTWPRTVKLAVNKYWSGKLKRELLSRSSLALYASLLHADFNRVRVCEVVALYLQDTYNQEGLRLKCKLRCNDLQLLSVVGRNRVPRWSDSQMACPVCGTGVVETSIHFISVCPAYASRRTRMLQELHGLLIDANPPVPEAVAMSNVVDSAGPRELARIVLGTREYGWNSYTLSIISKVSSNYLMLIWRDRQCVVTQSPNSLCGVVPIADEQESEDDLDRDREGGADALDLSVGLSVDPDLDLSLLD